MVRAVKASVKSMRENGSDICIKDALRKEKEKSKRIHSILKINRQDTGIDCLPWEQTLPEVSCTKYGNIIFTAKETSEVSGDQFEVVFWHWETLFSFIFLRGSETKARNCCRTNNWHKFKITTLGNEATSFFPLFLNTSLPIRCRPHAFLTRAEDFLLRIKWFE